MPNELMELPDELSERGARKSRQCCMAKVTVTHEVNGCREVFEVELDSDEAEAFVYAAEAEERYRRATACAKCGHPVAEHTDFPEADGGGCLMPGCECDPAARPADPVAAAVEFASAAHAGQVYRGHGELPDTPYILHPLRVLLQVANQGWSEGFLVAAALHDCQEDTGKLPLWLREDEAMALDLLTRRQIGNRREPYSAYIKRMLGERSHAGFIARTVKRADLHDHLARNPPGDLRSRYEDALAAILEKGPNRCQT